MFDLKIGFKCNNNCKHCVVASKREAGCLKLKDIKNILSKQPAGEVIQITGGEPSIFGDELLEILKYCKKKKLGTLIQTNATGFADKDFFKECRPYIDHCHVAIHSYDKDIHDFIVGSKGMWQKTIDGFKNIIDAGVACTTQTVLSQYNIDGLDKTYDFIQSIAPGIIMSMTYPHLMGNAWTNRDKVAFRYSDHKEVIQRCLEKYHNLIQTESIPPCYLYPYVDKVHWSLENNLISEEMDRTGIDFSDGIHNEKNYNYLDIKDRRKAPKCKECIYNERCVGVWKEYIELFKNNLDLYPIRSNCE